MRRSGTLTVLYSGAGVSSDDGLLDLCRGAFAPRSRSLSRVEVVELLDAFLNVDREP